MNENNDRQGARARRREVAWRDFALCAETDPDAFFPEKGQSPHPAQAVCGQCFVRSECLGYAMADTSLQGVWGGLTEQERWALRRGRAA